MSTKKNDQFDLVVYGATSFVGEIVCRYLIENYPAPKTLSWAMAGRSESKLASLKKKLGEQSSAIPEFIADCHDEAALTRFVSQTKVVISTVGPYALYGSTLVKVCAELGKDYCDLTGEVHWIHRMLEAHESTAKASGARIVNCSGFDSIPSDLGVYFLQQQAKAQFGEYCPTVKMSVKGISGGASGGTVASMLNVMAEVKQDPSLRRILANPYSICPADSTRNPKQKDVMTARRSTEFGSWLAPFVMATVNTRIVLRSHALTGQAYGDNFHYEETTMSGKGIKGAAVAHGTTAALASFLIASSISPLKNLLEKHVLPKPGEGPSEAAQLKGFFDLRFYGQTEAGDIIRTKVLGDRDPGYGSTAKMLVETAIGLLKNKSDASGFLTPSAALGDSLLQRLSDNAGLKFEVVV